MTASRLTRTNLDSQIQAAFEDLVATQWYKTWEKFERNGQTLYTWTDAFDVSRTMNPGEMADYLNLCGYDIRVGGLVT